MLDTKNSLPDSLQILSCKYCNKECKNLNSLKQHECRCKHNPNRKISGIELYNKSEHKVWNKGLTKETDERVAKNALGVQKYYETHDGVWKGKKMSEASCKKMSESALMREIGGYKSRKHSIIYNGIYLDSSYELLFAKDLDNNNIGWSRGIKFKYIDPINNISHTYTPDFYIPSLGLYVDTKNDYLINNINPNLGYNDLDKIKWVMEQNDITIVVLDKTHLTYSSLLQIADVSQAEENCIGNAEVTGPSPVISSMGL